LSKADNTIWSIYADVKEKEVYYGYWRGIKSLFNNFSQERLGFVTEIIKHKGRLLDTEGLLNETLTGRVLISEWEMKKKGVLAINSLMTDNEENLYALVWRMYNYSVIRLHEDDLGKYLLGEKILCYGTSNWAGRWQAIIVPGKLKGADGKTYPFSIVSCVNWKYLDLNGEKIEGTEVEKGIFKVELLSARDEKIDLIYSGNELKKIIRVKIEGRKVKEKEALVSGLSDWVCALEPVFDKKLHEKLIKFKKLKIKQDRTHL